MNRHATTVASFALAALASALAAGQSTERGDDASAAAALERSLIDVIAHVEPSVVAIARREPNQRQPVALEMGGDVFGEFRIAAAEARPVTTGAGVIIDPAGLVLTQYLAVRAGDRHTVTTIDGTTYRAELKAADPRSSLAVLEVANALQQAGQEANPERPDFPALRFGDAAALRKGQFVVAIGNPYAIQSDGQPTASWGIVANLARRAPVGANLNDAPGPSGDHRTTLHHLGTLIQTNAKLGWSAGGGALVNRQGELVGITTTVATIAGHEQPAGYAIPINAAMRRIIDALQEGREVEYGLLGVSFGSESMELSGGATNVTVGQVYPGSPAARAGLRSGDVITHVDDVPVHDVDGVQLAVSLNPPGSVTRVGYRRGGRNETAEVMLAKLAVAGHTIVTRRRPAWLGIHVDYATALQPSALAQAASTGAIDPEGCVLVSEVEPESTAWQAGVREGMFISHVGGQRVTTPAEFHEATRRVGNTLDIRLTQPLTPRAEENVDAR